jgi:hypothetical protein
MPTPAAVPGPPWTTLFLDVNTSARRPLTAVVRRLEQTALRPLVTGGVHAHRAPVTPG